MAVTSTKICDDYEDAKILEAAFVAMETGNMTPIIKQELRFIIQSRRLAEGKSELEVNFAPPEITQLTPEEHIKKDNRREQNRKASRKFRRKQTVTIHSSKKRIQHLECENTRLTSELTTLSREKDSLQRKLRSHLDLCGCVIVSAV